MVRKMKKHRVACLVAVVMLVVGVWKWSQRQSAAIAEFGHIYYEWTGPDWLEPVWRKTRIGFGYAKMGTVVFKGSNISDEDLAKLDLGQIDTLILECPSLTVRTASNLASLEDLRTLMLPTQNVNDEWIGEIAKNRNIEHLNLRGANITDKSIDALVSMGSLRSLDVGLTALSKEEVPRLVQMPMLGHLSIDPGQESDQLITESGKRAPKLYLRIDDSKFAGF
jgi:hypothetical protein